MIWELILSATIETGLGLLVEAGLGDSVKDLRERWLNTDQKKRQTALSDAIQHAIQVSTDEQINDLLQHRPFQEEVVRALLDPMGGFNVQAVEAYWGEKFPEHVMPLRRFFNALQNNLLADPIWGPILDRYQSIRFRQDVRQMLEAKNLPTSDDLLVRAVSQAVDIYRASVKGGGAIAQGANAKAVGANGILVEGSVGKIVQITINQFVKEPGKSGSSKKKYLDLTADHANLLPWTKMSTDHADPSRGESLSLADVYIDLDTTEMRHMEHEEELRQFLMKQREAERISAQEIVSRETKLLIMGDPGSGKSTFVKHLTYLMAKAAAADDPSVWLKPLSNWDHGALLPVRIELRHIAVHAEAAKNGDPKLILNYLRSDLTTWDMDSYWDEFGDLLQTKKMGILFLLDGLDEVPTSQRQVIVDSVNELSALYPQHRYVVTCRPYAYVGQPWQLSGFHEVTLAPFSNDQMDRFIENWYERLADRGRIERLIIGEKISSLKNAVRRRDLAELAERPLLLTVMAQLHAYAGQLPDDRTQLYANAVNLLLERWESRLGKENGILEYLNIPGLKISDLKSGLYEVAFRAHSSGDVSNGTADITEGQLREWLARYINNDWNKAGLFVEFIRERAGLLIRHKIEAYTFPHRSFQEFLAACYWLSLGDYPGEAIKMVRADWDRWREVFILAAGYAARNERLHQAIAVVNALMPMAYKNGQSITTEHFRSAVLAGQTLIEIGLVGVRREEAGLAVLERIQEWLLAAMRAENISPADRVEAGRTLAVLGDLREEVISIEKMIFCRVPAGEFIMGEKDKQRKVTLPEYFISQYPITNAQFERFVKAGGYKYESYWPEAKLAEWWSENGFKGSFDEESRIAPNDFGAPFNFPNHPVVGVSWYEALAFTRWLNEQVHAMGQFLVFKEENRISIQKDWQVTLPNEAEWEKAARGTDGRQYPWAGEFNTNFANTTEAGIKSTSAVGCFPQGVSPYGLQDVSGNVWEWMRNDYKSEKDDFQSKEDKGLRGGSFVNASDLARCASRDRYSPGSGGWYTGFRVVVVSPLLS